MTADRIKEIMNLTAYPNSVSVYQALLQVWTEVQTECNKKIGSCEKCEYRHDENTTQWCNKIEKSISLDWYCAEFKPKE
jgi:hypothetical protein